MTGKLFPKAEGKVPAAEVIKRYKTAKFQSAGAAEPIYRDDPDEIGFDFKVVMRKVEKNSLIDITD